MKKLIYFLSILFLTIILVLNLFYNAYLMPSEHIVLNINSISYSICVISLAILIFLTTIYIDDYLYNNISSDKVRKNIFLILIIIYIFFNIIWLIIRRPPIVGDQIHICNLAQIFYSGNSERFLYNITYAGIPLIEYMGLYHQQIPLAFVFSVFFRIIHCDFIGVLRILNLFGNITIIISIYKINCKLSKKYKTNKTLLIILISTFVPLIMLSTFIYGDIPGMALCLVAICFTMRYTETRKTLYLIIASFFYMIAYMMRMNYVIFIIATIIYLVLDLYDRIKKKDFKPIMVFSIIAFIIISIIPSNIVQAYYLKKYNLNKEKKYPNISYFLMAMEESWRGNGWYNEEIGEYALKNPDKASQEYPNKIRSRLIYFSENIGYFIEFYTQKLASMWTENTYSAIRSNLIEENDPLEKVTIPLTFYEKAILLTICICSIIAIIKNRKNISLEILFLLTIFVGGFSFHILWEAKSRYIIPYIIVLIPIASISIDNIKFQKK